MPRGSSAPQARLEAIETLLLWEGRVSRSRLLEFFDVHETLVSRDIASYRGAHPDACAADTRWKGYVALPTIRPTLTKGNFSDYLALIGAGGHGGLFTNVPVESSFVEATRIDYWNFARIHEAVRLGRSLRIEYRSMSNPRPHERIIRPHAFIQAGPRWHVRAYCQSAQGFRDFNLGRLSRVIGAVDEILPGAEEDTDWGTAVKVRLVPHRDLNAEQSRMIRQEYMGGTVAIAFDVRAPLVKYLIQSFRASVDPDRERTPEHLLMVDHPEALPSFATWTVE